MSFTEPQINKQLFNQDAAGMAAAMYDAHVGDLVNSDVHLIDGAARHKAMEALAKESQKLESPTKMEVRTQVVNTRKVGPNQPCPCGSGKKNKKCCRLSTEYKEITHKRMVVLDPDVAKALKAAKRQGKTVRMK